MRDRTESWFTFHQWLRILAPFALAALAFLILIAIAATHARAGERECLRSAAAVHERYPGSWATWKYRVPRQRGERCWFPDERRRPVRQAKRGKPAANTVIWTAPAPPVDLDLNAALSDRVRPGPVGVPMAMVLWEMGWR